MVSRPEWPRGQAQRAPPRPQLCSSPPAPMRGGKREPSASPGAVMQLPVAKTRRPQHSKMVTHYDRDDGVKSFGTPGDLIGHAEPGGLEEDDDERLALGRAAAHEDSGLGSSVTNDSRASHKVGDEGFDVPGSFIRSCPGSAARGIAWPRASMDLDDSPFQPAVTSSWKRDEDCVDSAKSRRHNFSAAEQSTLDELLGKKAEANDSGAGTKHGGAAGARLLEPTGRGAVPDARLFLPVVENRDSGIGLTPNASVLDYDESGDASGRDCPDGGRASASPALRFLKTPQPNRAGRERGAAANCVFRTPVTALTHRFCLELSSPGGCSSWCSPLSGGGRTAPCSPDADGSFSAVFSDRRCIVTECGGEEDERGLDGSGDDLTPDMWRRSHRLGRLQRLSTIREAGSQSDVVDDAAAAHRRREAAVAAAFAAAASDSAGRRQAGGARGRHRAAERDGGAKDAAACTPPACAWSDCTPPPLPPISGVVTADAAHTPALRLAQEAAWRFCKGLHETTPVAASATAATAGMMAAARKHSQAQLDVVMKQALADVPVAVRNSPSLKQLIGRKMGSKSLDIIAALEKRNLKHVLCQLLGYLSPADRDRARRVSAVWRTVVQREEELGLWAAAETPKLVPVIWHKENTPEQAGEDVAGTRWHQAERPALSRVQSLAWNAATARRSSPLAMLGQCRTTPSPTNCPAAGSRASSLHERFVEVGRTLNSDELLRKCPRCQSPARLRSAEERALCTRESCSYDFCVVCLCQWHGARPCSPAQPARHGNREALPGTKQSKRNLKRL